MKLSQAIDAASERTYFWCRQSKTAKGLVIGFVLSAFLHLAFLTTAYLVSEHKPKAEKPTIELETLIITPN